MIWRHESAQARLANIKGPEPAPSSAGFFPQQQRLVRAQAIAQEGLVSMSAASGARYASRKQQTRPNPTVCEDLPNIFISAVCQYNLLKDPQVTTSIRT
ncbi:MAG: hypothetical protein ACKV22_27475 [Bryobacteraceae bacterium]